MIQLNDLLGYKNRKIYQDDNYFSFTLDSILLLEFIKLNATTKQILDIGSGTGIFPLVLSLRTNAHIDAVEIQKELYELLKKNIEYNKLTKEVSIYLDDINSSTLLNRNNYYDHIVCNPPYFKETIMNESEEKTIARHELSLSIENVIKISKKLLKHNGKLTIVYDTKRLEEVMQLLSKYKMIPKRIKFIHSNLEKEASIFLLECRAGANPGLKVEAPFILYEKDGTMSYQYQKILEEREK